MSQKNHIGAKAVRAKKSAEKTTSTEAGASTTEWTEDHMSSLLGKEEEYFQSGV